MENFAPAPSLPGRPPMPGGSTAPAAVKPVPEGMRQRGRVMVGGLVSKLLMEAARMLDPMSEEGQDVMKALGILGKRFGHASDDLTRQEGKMLSESAGPMSQPGPENMKAFQSLIGGRLGQMGGSPQPAAPAAPPMAGAA